MTTLSAMKTRIAQEVRRKAYADVDSIMQSAIDDAITSAIGAYNDERFFFNESRDTTFPTVIDQEFYDSSDAADLANLLKIDYVTLSDGAQSYQLIADYPAEIESASSSSTATGQPGWYLFYDRKIRLYPIPTSAVWTIRVAGTFKYAAPASDAEADNFWMTDAERLIRCRAKYELGLHVLRDLEMAQTMGSATSEAFEQLKRRTARMTQRSDGKVRPMAY